MRIPGVVEVYQVGDAWVARSWPKVQNQPNSAAQLLWRKKFRDAHKAVSSFRGTYLDAWRGIQCPPGKMWIDVAIHSHLMMPEQFDNIPTVSGCKFELYYSASGFDLIGLHFAQKYAWFFNENAKAYYTIGYGLWNTYGSTWPTVFKWADLGFICPNGKRPKKHWKLTYKYDNKGTGVRVEAEISGQTCWILLYDNIPDGLTLLKMYGWPSAPETRADYALIYPPIFAPVRPWPGAFVP